MIKSLQKYSFLFLGFLLLMVEMGYGQNIIPPTTSSSNTVIQKDLKDLLQKSLAYISNKNWEACDSTTQILIQRAVTMESRYYQGRGYLLLGKVYTNQNQDAKAFLNFLRSSKLFFIIDDYQYLAESELEKGKLYNRRELWDKAYTSLALADSLYQSVHFSFDLVDLFGNLGTAAYHLEKNNDALLFLGLYRRYSVVHQQWEDQKKAIQMLVKTYRRLGNYNAAIQYDMELVTTFRQKKNDSYYHAILELANDFLNIKNYPQAEANYIIVYKNSKRKDDVIHSYLQLSKIASKTGKPIEAVTFLNKAWAVVNDNNSKVEIINQLTNIYISQLNYDKAKEYNVLAMSLLDSVLIENKFKVYDLAQEIAVAKKNYKEALKYTKVSANISDSLLVVSFENKSKLAALNSQINRYELSQQFEFVKDNLNKLTEEKQQLKEEKIQQELQLLRLEKNTKKIEEENLKLRLKQAEKDALLFKQKLDNQAKEAQLITMRRRDTISQLVIASDSILRLQHQQDIERIAAEKKVVQLEADRAKRRNIYLLSTLVLAIFSLVVFLISLRKVKKSNLLLGDKNAIIKAKNEKLAYALEKLKAAQSQLIEKERLASLGQLTTGIAHEIRNPLNFVNNFAQLSHEYTEEIEELIKSNESSFPKEIRGELFELSNYLNENSQKILDHGTRASRIIEQMLKTARSGQAVKEATNLNHLIEDSVKLAYQGVRGDYPNFIADLNFNLDSSITNVNLVAQDMGRVFINLTTNSCHAMISKLESEKDYEPTLNIRSYKKQDSIFIEIMDNGKGMPLSVQKEIFNPFYTTKAPGKGTGLGLTMSFDIVEKLHGGKISFESEVNKYTRFIIELPNS